MIVKFPSTNRVFRAKMERWQVEAIRWYLLTIFVSLVTPLVASYVQNFAAPEAARHFLARVTIGSWMTTYLVSLTFTFMLVELFGKLLMKINDETIPDGVEKTVAKLAHRANIPVPQVIYLAKDSLLNAAALRTFLHGNKVLLMGEVRKLTPAQLEAVLAHEVAHIAMKDVWFHQLAGAVFSALQLLNFFLLCGLGVSFVATWFLPFGHELTWLLLVTYVVTALGVKVAKLTYLAYQRVCEYRADAIAVELTTPAHREHLVAALRRIRGLRFIAQLRKSEKSTVDIASTHPTVTNRAKELGVE